MKILNLSEAKQVAFYMSKQIYHGDLFLIHSDKVGRVAKMIAQKIGVDDNVFEIAGWVHDIGYSKDLENHADYAIPILQELGYEVDEILKDCILNHGNGKYPKTTEGKIFQLADKFSIFDSDIIEVVLRHGTFPMKTNDVNFFKAMSESSFKLLENFSNEEKQMRG